MPSFLSKVFGRKKEDTNKDARPPQRPPSDASLLDGKFEAITGTPTPTTPRFDLPDPAANDKEKDKDGFGLFKSKSNRTSPAVTPGDHSVAQAQNKRDYHLSLNLPGPKEEASRALGVVFEADPDGQILLPESVIAERRLSPLEAFLLVQTCAQTINAHGLETLGIMIPHWYSASPQVQRKLISLFIQSLALKSPITTLSPTASSPVSAFESEISATRSPHDVAAVLRWGLRHLQLDSASFGKDEQWYTQFLDAEKASEYPPRAFTEKLVPLLPPAHLHLLTATLEIFSSLAAHSEANSASGSKLSKMLGLWLLSTPRVEAGDDTLSLYAKWETCGKILEHLFLARIRDEAADHRMPTRLTELVKHYPYAKAASTGADAAFLPSPRFSTRHYDALFVRIETEIPSGTVAKAHKNHPLRLIADALKASTRSASTSDVTINGSQSSEVELWESLKKHVSVADADSESYPGLSSLFADETIRFLSLIPTSTESEAKASATPFTLFIPPGKVERRRSMSLSDQDKAIAAIASAHVKAASSSTSDSSEPIAIDWSQFSTSGFFSETTTPSGNIASTLLDNKDVEVTIPRVLSARRKLPPALIPLPSSRGKSLDLPAPKKSEEKEVKQGKSKATKFEIVQLDEAFIDFWSDALLDPISTDWPAFVVCKIKSSVPAVNTADSKRVGWLIIEQRFVAPRVTSQPIVVTPDKEVPAARPRPNSPKPSFASDSKSTKKKRFSFFTSLSTSSISSSSTHKSESTKGKKKAGKGLKVGEMGEILQEEEEPSASSSAKTNGAGPSVSSAEVAAVATGVVAVASTAVLAAAAPTETPKAEAPAPTLVEDAGNIQVAPPAVEESKPAPAVDATSSLVEDAAQAQVPQPAMEPAFGASAPTVVDAAAAVEPEVVAEPGAEPSAVAEPAAELSVEGVAVETAAAIEPEVPEHVESVPPPVVEPEAPKDAAPDAAQADHERVAAEAAQAQLAKEKAEAEERERAELARLEEGRQIQAEKERVAAEAAERARVERERLEEAERLRLEEERLAEERRVHAEQERIAAEEALAKENLEAEERARLEEERQVQVEKERVAAEEAERARLERERLEEEERMRAEEERLAEERRVQAEQERIAAEEEAERVRLAAEKSEQERLAAEAAEKERLEQQRLAEEARLAAEKAEQERIAAEEAEKARIEQERLAEEARLAAEEAERERLEQERLAEEARLAAEKAEQDRLAAEAAERERLEQLRLAEEARLAAERAEQERLAAEAAEKDRLEQERLAEEARLAAEAAEKERLEQERLAEEARLAAEKAEQERLAAEAAEKERLEQERLAEDARLAAEKAEQERLAAEEAEKERLEQERLAEEARLAAEQAEQERLEQERLAEEARLAAEAAEKERLEQERLAEEARLAAEKAEQERLSAEAAEKERLEQERLAEEAHLAAEKAEQERLAAEAAEKERLEQERLAEEARVAAEAAEKERLEQERLAEEARLAAEKAEQERLAAEAAEKERLEQERLAEEARLRAEKAEQERLAAEEAEKARLEQERLEEERRLQAENDRLAAEAAEKERREQERAAQEAEPTPEPAVMIVNDEPVTDADAVPEELAPPALAPGEAAAPVELTPIEPEAPSAEGLQFDTTAEVIGSGHVEPLREPETANDKLVDLPAVPVVEARPELMRGSTVISHLELTPSPDEPAKGDDGMLPGGETVGPQAALSIAEEEPAAEDDKHTAEDAPLHEANGNGVNGHAEAETPAE